MRSLRFFFRRLLVICFPLCDVLGGSGAAAARSLQAGRGQTQVPFHGPFHGPKRGGFVQLWPWLSVIKLAMSINIIQYL